MALMVLGLVALYAPVLWLLVLIPAAVLVCYATAAATFRSRN
jgi:hypothetical protein